MKKAFLATVALPLVMLTAGCGDMMQPPKTPEQKKAETIEALNRDFGMQVRDVTLPKAFHDLPAGQYEVTVQTKTGEKDCIASVVKTTHGYTNVILNCP